MLTTILLTSSLLLVVGMCVSLACLAVVSRRESATAETSPLPRDSGP
jgi:hypothetical protein